MLFVVLLFNYYYFCLFCQKEASCPSTDESVMSGVEPLLSDTELQDDAQVGIILRDNVNVL